MIASSIHAHGQDLTRASSENLLSADADATRSLREGISREWVLHDGIIWRIEVGSLFEISWHSLCTLVAYSTLQHLH